MKHIALIFILIFALLLMPGCAEQPSVEEKNPTVENNPDLSVDNANTDESEHDASVEEDPNTQDVENQPDTGSEDTEQPPEDPEEQEVADDPDHVTLEDFLAMTDEELALNVAAVELVQEDGAYVLNADLSQWTPVTTGSVISGDGSEADAGTVQGNPGANLLFRQNFTMMTYCGKEDAERFEEAALLMAKRYLHLCMNPMVTSSQTKFIVTAYKNLSVDVYAWDELPEEYQQQIEPYVIDEFSTDKGAVWYVIPTVTYQYKGTMNGVESDGTEWFTESYSGNCCLMLHLYIPEFEGMEDDPQLEQWPHMYDPRYNIYNAIA